MPHFAPIRRALALSMREHLGPAANAVTDEVLADIVVEVAHRLDAYASWVSLLGGVQQAIQPGDTGVNA